MPEHHHHDDYLLKEVLCRLLAVERRLDEMPTRADFDNAFNDLRTAIEAAFIRCQAGGGPTLTDQDIANLNAATGRVNTIGAGGGGTTPGSVSFRPSSVTGGAVVTASIVLAAPAAAGGEVFDLSSDSADATVQAQATVSAGATTVDFAVNTRPVAAATKVTITCTSPFHTFKNTFTINP